jgi:hypothetical protein
VLLDELGGWLRVKCDRQQHAADCPHEIVACSGVGDIDPALGVPVETVTTNAI